ncbi:MAG: SlyX family protein [Porticoccaceae bacterium]|nr:SlyX family protein [Porticoccaceae bacterium]|tara:strand:+ start:6368 stop:6577 length:210 start_codon:yes stop_codon:yes gene_type:complete
MSEERFQELEEKLAFFEMTNAELGDEIFRQKKEIDTLTKAHQKLLQRVESLQDTVDTGGQEDGERPPHY